MGVPKTGIFGLVDLVGVDLMPHLKTSLASTLPADDPYHAIARDMPLIDKMIARRAIPAARARAASIRLNRGEADASEALDLATGEYREQIASRIVPAGPAEGDLARAGRDARQGRAHMPGRCSAARWPMPRALVREAADNVVAIDDAMKLGYNWKYGPFELIDQTRRGLARAAAGGGGPPGAGDPEPRRRSRVLPRRERQAAVSRHRRRLSRRRPPRRRAAAGGHQAAFPADRCRTPRQRCGTSATASPPRVHRQDERARRRGHEADRRGDPAGRERDSRRW